MAWDQQSPINLRASFTSKAPAGYLHLAWGTAIDGFLHHGDHGVEVIFPPTPSKYLELEGKRFVLRQFHLHHPAEHLIEGTLHDAELHVVHQNLDDATFAVVGVPLTVDPNAKENREAVGWVKSFAAARENKTVAIPLKPASWLPVNHDRIYRYEGSLTTEPFTETVSWIVFPEPKAISPALFAAIFGEHPQKARGIQARNRRFVLDLDVSISIAK